MRYKEASLITVKFTPDLPGETGKNHTKCNQDVFGLSYKSGNPAVLSRRG
jgi:hypothetical protein